MTLRFTRNNFTAFLPVCAFILLLSGMSTAQAQTVQPGNNFSAGNGMEMIWVAPLNGWAGKYLVTQDEYQKVMGTSPSYYKGPRHPVEMVSWNDALAYCKKLTDQDHASNILPSGCQYNLPTDAQFDAFVGDAGGMDDAAQLLNQRKPNLTSDVGTRKANQFGLYDTRGLIWQWCLNDYDRKVNAALPIVKKYYWLTGAPGKVLRGGTFPHLDEPMPLAYRCSAKPDFHYCMNGFRVVVIPKQ